MELRRSAEDYLEAIYIIKQQKGIVRSIDVAHHLDYSKPSVSRAMGNLKKDGYIEMRPDGELLFTKKGLQTAENIYERHTILTQLFTSIGVPKEIAAADACRVEHAISEETFERLKATHRHRITLPLPVEEADSSQKKKSGKE